MIPKRGDFVVETDGLRKSFRKIEALRGVNLRVPRHSVFDFLGSNSSGKTQLT